MDKKRILFDFDKTLTYDDSLLGFFAYCTPKGFLFPFKLLLYFVYMVLAKLKIKSILSLKNFGISLFISGIEKEKLLKLSTEYAFRIKTNKVYKEMYKYEHKNDEKIVVSASFSEYVKPLFPDALLLCSELIYKDNKPYKVGRHCFGKEKVKMLQEQGIESVYECYTDSLHDLPLIEMSLNKFLVRGDSIIRCMSVDEFRKLAAR